MVNPHFMERKRQLGEVMAPARASQQPVTGEGADAFVASHMNTWRRRRRGLLKAGLSPHPRSETCNLWIGENLPTCLTACQEGRVCKNVFVKPLDSVQHIVGVQQATVSFVSPFSLG